MFLLRLLALYSLFLPSRGFETISFIGSSLRNCRSHHSTMTAYMTENDADICQVPLPIHHTALKTRNITLAMDFYGLFGFEPTRKFRAGPARAAWLEQRSAANIGSSSHIEIIEVPSYMLNEPEGMKRRALDLMQKPELLGLNHLALEVTNSIQALGMSNLSEWLVALNQKSVKVFGKTMRIALEPKQALIGSSVYEIAFLYDADGALLELLNKQKDLPQDIDSGWEPLEDDFFQNFST